MHQAASRIYEFDGFQLDPGKRALLECGRVIPLTPKVFDTLHYMLEHAGETFSKEALMQAVWPDTIVEENNLNQNISTLRRLLGEKRGENRYIAPFREEATVSPQPSALRAHPWTSRARQRRGHEWRLRCFRSTT
jgi:DNA-binding winged helix-turn-helix (wHTH) protein